MNPNAKLLTNKQKLLPFSDYHMIAKALDANSTTRGLGVTTRDNGGPPDLAGTIKRESNTLLPQIHVKNINNSTSVHYMKQVHQILFLLQQLSQPPRASSRP